MVQMRRISDFHTDRLSLSLACLSLDSSPLPVLPFHPLSTMMIVRSGAAHDRRAHPTFSPVATPRAALGAVTLPVTPRRHLLMHLR